MVKTAKSMTLLWQSHFGLDYKDAITDDFIKSIYNQKFR